MFSKVPICALLILILLCGTNACTRNNEVAADGAQAQNGGTQRDGDGTQDGDAAQSSNLAQTTIDDSGSMLEGGAPVPAKRIGLTVDDRARWFQALGMHSEAQSSASFLKYMEKMYADVGKKFENAGFEFHSLGGKRYLAQIMIDQGAYAGTYYFALYEETNSQEAMAKLLRFDRYREKDGEIVKTIEAELIGYPSFNQESKVLTMYSPARGIGGCGTQTKHRFENGKVVTTEARYQGCDDSLSSTQLSPDQWKKLPLSNAGNAALDDEAFKHMMFAHAAALKEWLATKPDLRPSQAAEYGEKKLAYLRQDYPNQHPYYLTGDFNRDGRQDFAVILGDKNGKRIDARTSREVRSLAIFEAPPYDGRQAQPVFFSDSIDGLYILHHQQGKSLYVGSYASDDGFLLEPSGEGYKVVSLLSDI